MATGFMVILSATVRNEYGIHVRPSAEIAKEAQLYPGTITVRDEVGQANAKSILELIGLALGHGHTVTIAVDGPDAAAVAERFVALFEKQFEFTR